MTKEERAFLILRINMFTGMSMELLESLEDSELERIHIERIEQRHGNTK